MKANIINNVTNNTATSVKEEKKMTLKERWMASLEKGQDLGYAAAHKTGYVVGYATTTVKEEVAYATRKITNAISKTGVAHEIRDGYYVGRSDATAAFDCRVSKREEKARARADAKAAKAAAEELFDEFEDSVCGDGMWNA